MKTLIVVSSYHHGNTRKVAHAIADALGAQVVSTGEVKPETLGAYDLIGFGSGIYSAAHHPQLLKLVNRLPAAEGGKAFVFSTDGMPRFAVKNQDTLRRKMLADHRTLRRKLEGKGYRVVGEFNCAGFNTNSFLQYFGGLNRGRPNADDLARAAAFANDLSANLEKQR